MANGPVVLCFDGSTNAEHAIEEAARLLGARPAIVLVVSQTAASTAFPWAGMNGMGGVGINLTELDEAVAAAAQRTAEAGAALATAAGFTCEAVSAKADGPVWNCIVNVADERDAVAIVLGSRGLTGIKSMVVGSTSDGVLHHAHRTTIVVPAANDAAGKETS